jgi:excisionase family DNA binding protein
MPAPTTDDALIPSARHAERLERLVFSPNEVADMLGTSRAHIYNMMSRKELRYTMVGKLRRIPRSEVDRLVTLSDAPQDGAA